MIYVTGDIHGTIDIYKLVDFFSLESQRKSLSKKLPDRYQQSESLKIECMNTHSQIYCITYALFLQYKNFKRSV